MDIKKAFADARQDRDIQVGKLEVEYHSKLHAAGIYFAEGVFGNLATQVGYMEIAAWRNTEREKISEQYIARIEGIALAYTSDNKQ